MFSSKVISFESDVQAVTHTHTHTGPLALPGPLEWSAIIITVFERRATRNWVCCQFIWSCSRRRWDKLHTAECTYQGRTENCLGVITRSGYVRECSVFNDVDYSLAVYTFCANDVKVLLLTIIGSCSKWTRSSAIAEGPRDASCQLKSCQTPCTQQCRNYLYCNSEI